MRPIQDVESSPLSSFSISGSITGMTWEERHTAKRPIRVLSLSELGPPVCCVGSVADVFLMLIHYAYRSSHILTI
jgi:hypothetical protein